MSKNTHKDQPLTDEAVWVIAYKEAERHANTYARRFGLSGSERGDLLDHFHDLVARKIVPTWARTTDFDLRRGLAAYLSADSRRGAGRYVFTILKRRARTTPMVCRDASGEWVEREIPDRLLDPLEVLQARETFRELAIQAREEQEARTGAREVLDVYLQQGASQLERVILEGRLAGMNMAEIARREVSPPEVNSRHARLRKAQSRMSRNLPPAVQDALALLGLQTKTRVPISIGGAA